MNPQSYMFGRLTINDSQIDLGHATVPVLFQRVLEQLTKHKGEATQIDISFGKTRVESFAEIDTRKLVQREFESLTQKATPAGETELFPGITVARAYEAESSPAGSAYKSICDPSKRVGVPTEVIDSIRDEYFEQFPDVAPHYPVWIQSAS